jgi:oxygen-dependent protoporphyrinogen oxidase
MVSSQSLHIVVVGSGIAGLAAAHRVIELSPSHPFPPTLTLIEANGRLGGTIATEQRDGFLLELGPDSLISEKPWALALCQRIGLESHLIGTRSEYRSTLVVHRGRLEPLPEGFVLLAPTKMGPLVRSRLFSWPGKLRMALDLVLPRAGQQDDESLGAFVRRRLGREALERVAQPLIGGIYTADPDHLSLAATMPRFLQMERNYRSVIRAMWRAGRNRPQETQGASGARWGLFVTFRQGMQELVNALAARLPARSARCHTAAVRVLPDDGQWLIELADRTVLTADGVVLATPAYQAASLVQDLDPHLADGLARIPYSSAATVSLAFRREQVRHPLSGFGFVVPRSENRSILACTFSSVKYAGRAPEGHVLLRAFVGGALQEELFSLSDQETEQAVRRELAELLGIDTAPLFVRISRHPRSMPQYLVGHLGRVAAIEQRLASYPGLTLAGSAYRGVGIADCVRSGEAAAETLLAHLSADRVAPTASRRLRLSRGPA